MNGQSKRSLYHYSHQGLNKIKAYVLPQNGFSISMFSINCVCEENYSKKLLSYNEPVLADNSMELPQNTRELAHNTMELANNVTEYFQLNSILSSMKNGISPHHAKRKQLQIVSAHSVGG